MNIEQVDPKILKPAEYNPRQMTKKQAEDLSASIDEFGMVDPLIVNKHEGRENVIIGGHQRHKIALQKGFETIPVVYVDLDEKQEQKLNLRLNKNLGEWDYDLLANFTEEDLLGVGFESEELDKIFQLDESEDDFDAEAEAEKILEPKSKLGDIYKLEKHRLMCGDATKKEDVEKLMGEERAELLFTSPPYSDMRQYGGNKDLSVEILSEFIKVFYPFVEYQIINLGIQRKNGEIYEYWNEYIKKAKDIGYKFLSWNVWNRTMCGTIAHQTAMFGIEHEWLLVFGKERKRLNRTIEHSPNSAKRRKYARGSQRRGDVLVKENWGVGYDKKQLGTVITITPLMARSKDYDHPAMFPVGLPVEHIKAVTKIKDIVIDCFGGSGSTLIACEQLNRRCFMMEIDPKYCDVIINRWEKFTNKKAIKI